MRWRFRNSLAKLLLDSSCAAALLGPKTRQPRRVNSSTTPSDERQLGPDHGQVGTDLFRHRHQRVNAFHVGSQAYGLFSDTAIAGRAIHLRNPRGLAQLPYQRMLAPTASDDQNFHSRRLTRLGGRAGDVKRGD